MRPPSAQLRSLLSMLVLLVMVAPLACSQEPTPPVSLEQWMHGPDQGLRGWDVHFLPPVLTFQLRYAIGLRAHARATEAKIVGHNLHVFVRVADEASNWFPEKRYQALKEVPRGNDVAVSVAEEFLAKPGTYRIVLLVYDATSGKYGVWHKTMHVPSDAALPAYPDAPAIQFVNAEQPFPRTPSRSLPR